MISREQQIKEGRRRLKKLMGRARAEARKLGRDTEMRPLSVLGQSMTGRITEKNFHALVVYQGSKGGWFGDLVLKGMPTGVPDAMGTPSSDPRATREEALRDAFAVLVGILAQIDEYDRAGHDTKPGDGRVFELYGFSFTIPGEMVDGASGLAQLAGVVESYSFEDAQDFISRATREISGVREFSGEMYDEASPEAKSRLLAAIATMMIFGHFRYPVRYQSNEST
jgi:hypothetical protein